MYCMYWNNPFVIYSASDNGVLEAKNLGFPISYPEPHTRQKPTALSLTDALSYSFASMMWLLDL